MPPLLDLRPQRVPPRARIADDLIPLALDLVLGGPFAPPDTVELIVDLAAGDRIVVEPAQQPAVTIDALATDDLDEPLLRQIVGDDRIPAGWRRAAARALAA